DGIRDFHVTGVQTCALPIYGALRRTDRLDLQSGRKDSRDSGSSMAKLVFGMNQSLDGYVDHTAFGPSPTLFRHFIEEARRQAGKIGRASCREGEWRGEDAGT